MISHFILLKKVINKSYRP